MTAQMQASGFNRQQRLRVLQGFGANRSNTEKLLDYCTNRFNPPVAPPTATMQQHSHLPDEPFTAAWQSYFESIADNSPVQVLQKPLVQWNFPVREGISGESAYIDVTRRFHAIENCTLATGHQFEFPDQVTLQLYTSAAGSIPIISFATRQDFTYAWRALIHRNEPVPLPAGIGAAMLSGYNNLDRIQRYKEQHTRLCPDLPWSSGLKSMLADRSLYQDKLILVSPGPYSGIPASKMQLSVTEWDTLSANIRIHHEAAHYFTKRVCGAMNSNLHDELIADYMGIRLASGRYQAQWFLRFMGIDESGYYTTGKRMQHYTGDIEAASPAFEVLKNLLIQAANNLQSVDEATCAPSSDTTPPDVMLALTTVTLEELASDQGITLLTNQINHITTGRIQGQ